MSCYEWQWTLCPLAIKLFTLTQTATMTQRSSDTVYRPELGPHLKEPFTLTAAWILEAGEHLAERHGELFLQY